MKTPKLVRLSREHPEDAGAEERQRLTEAELAGFVDSLVEFERARTDRRSGQVAPASPSPAPAPATLEGLRAAPAAKRPFAIKSE
jgi:hypothetical protein